MAEAHAVARMIKNVADGAFPPVDGRVDVVPPYREGVAAAISLTGHAVVATLVRRERLIEAGADGFGGVQARAVVAALAGPGGRVDTVDVLLVGRGTGATRLPERRDLTGHPRVAHARRWRDDVQVHGDERGLVTVGRGVGGLPELSFEVRPGLRGRGMGRALLGDGRGLVAAGEPVLVAVAPGNAASLRAALAAGFVPIGSVQLFELAPDVAVHGPSER